ITLPAIDRAAQSMARRPISLEPNQPASTHVLKPADVHELEYAPRQAAVCQPSRCRDRDPTRPVRRRHEHPTARLPQRATRPAPLLNVNWHVLAPVAQVDRAPAF